MKIRYRIFNLIVAVLLIAIVIGNVFAWFSAKDAELEITGASAGAYFAYGDGTKDKDGDGQIHGPYGITTPTHLFNLAWLQNTGKIDPETYFELGADITIEKGYVLPPIGNATNPFNSVFNGNGHTIDGLIVSTNKNVLHGNPADADYKFSNAVGMFGMTGEDSEIKNFILTDPTVEVSNVNTTYSAITSADPAAVGLAIGYVNGKASSIGVKGGKYSVLREMSGDEKYKTYNSILGGMSDDAAQDNSITGSGESDTGVLYPKNLYDYLSTTSTTYSTFSSSVVNFSQNIWLNSNKTHNELGLGGISFTTGKDTRVRDNQQKDNTTFTYVGNRSYDTSKNTNENLTIDLDPKLYDGNNAEDNEEAADNIKAIAAKVKANGAQLTELSHEFYFNNSPTMNSVNVYTPDPKGETLGSIAENKINTSTIKVNITSETGGNLFIIMRASSLRTIGIDKFDSLDYSKPEDFIKGTSSETQVKNLVADIDISIPDGNNLYGYNVELNGKGSYIIYSEGSAFAIVYASIEGMAGGNTGELKEGALSAIDFIYDDVTINQEEVSYTDGDNGTKTLAPGNFIYANKLYTASQVRIYYNSISATLYISFARTSTSFDVTYNNEAEPQTSGSGSVKFKYDSAFTFTVP